MDDNSDDLGSLMATQDDKGGEIDGVLEGLGAIEAKRRESTILKLIPEALGNERVVRELERIYEHDPQHYVRKAAHGALVKAGALAPAAFQSPIAVPPEYVPAISAGSFKTPETALALKELVSESAKRREQVVLRLSPDLLGDAQVLRALRLVADTDPVHYVREAARKQLARVGEVREVSKVPLELGKGGGYGLCGALGLLVVLGLLAGVVSLAATAGWLGPQVQELWEKLRVDMWLFSGQ